jgi:hypothetical protein
MRPKKSSDSPFFVKNAANFGAALSTPLELPAYSLAR